ncbi:MAG TPA: sigma 54-interacting transcriptional regulator [Bryobacteraceae bacterium]|jgi:DNA-binding NtrC family response regulator
MWLRPNGRTEIVSDLEERTQLRVAVSSTGWGSWRNIAPRIQLILIELPLDPAVIQETLWEAKNASTPVPVVIYDKEAEFDESLVSPPTAFQHVTRPLTAEELQAVVCGAIEQAFQSPAAFPAREPWADLLIGESRPMRDLHALVRLVGPRQSTVLITGETGTGKEMVARAIHMASRRASARMVAVNCAAIPENLVEAELFGHAKGAFTGALNDRAGRFEQAHRGTILLDEIGEIPTGVQAKLLRVLQEREIQRVGGTSPIAVDARVIAASNINLEAAVAEKRFRDDLLYRLNVVPIRVPALRERSSDIPLLAEHFIGKICDREALERKQLSGPALRLLMNYEWPGNVRQLEHAIEMAVTLSGDREQLYAGDFPLPTFRTAPQQALASDDPGIRLQAGADNFDSVMARVEKLLLQEALRQSNGNKAKAANLLGLPRTTLLYKVKALEACTA